MSIYLRPTVYSCSTLKIKEKGYLTQIYTILWSNLQQHRILITWIVGAVDILLSDLSRLLKIPAISITNLVVIACKASKIIFKHVVSWFRLNKRLTISPLIYAQNLKKKTKSLIKSFLYKLYYYYVNWYSVFCVNYESVFYHITKIFDSHQNHKWRKLRVTIPCNQRMREKIVISHITWYRMLFEKCFGQLGRS